MTYAAIGLLLAAATYVRPECALLAVPIVLVLLLSRRSRSSRAVRSTAAVALVAALVVPLVPWLVRDASATGGRLVPMEADGGVALLASVDQYDGVMSEGFADVKVWDAQVARLVGVPPRRRKAFRPPSNMQPLGGKPGSTIRSGRRRRGCSSRSRLAR